ncbi:MAG TPA: hypothetical protein VFI82_01025 [Terriglobales bacterium]|nr:hypothetical protein [Terriglobales bacterium]
MAVTVVIAVAGVDWPRSMSDDRSAIRFLRLTRRNITIFPTGFVTFRPTARLPVAAEHRVLVMVATFALTGFETLVLPTLIAPVIARTVTVVIAIAIANDVVSSGSRFIAIVVIVAGQGGTGGQCGAYC